MDIKYTFLGHPALLCNDIEAEKKFYIDVMGFEEAFTLFHDDGTPWLTYIEITDNQFLELFHTKYPSPNRTSERSFHHFCLEVDDMAATLEMLKSKGVTVYRGPVDNGRVMDVPNHDHQPGMCGTLCAFIRDPEGNDIELQQYTPCSMQIRESGREAV
ncbi:VOC family protein [Feifania hominis]|uniref:VOC family protein n=1 Tax=Feifania hominis TaxID=2763660 RepID=A0A926DFY7_9FIRM|nr:VOC family protein [Feifania hominis]MBC8537146.1 VOC family protein [Feifania hominis]